MPDFKSPAKLSSTKKNTRLVAWSSVSSAMTSAGGLARQEREKNVWIAQNSHGKGQPRPVSINPMGR